MSLILKISLIALVGTVLTNVLGENKREFVLPLRLCIVTISAALVFSFADGKIRNLLSLINETQLPFDISSLLMKGAAICVVCGICASLCRENGNSSTADILELSGRIITIVLCLPLIEAVIETAISFV